MIWFKYAGICEHQHIPINAELKLFLFEPGIEVFTEPMKPMITTMQITAFFLSTKLVEPLKLSWRNVTED